MTSVRRESSAITIGHQERVVVEPRAPQTPYLVSSSRASTPSRIFRSVDGDQGVCVCGLLRLCLHAPALPQRGTSRARRQTGGAVWVWC